MGWFALGAVLIVCFTIIICTALVCDVIRKNG